MSLLLRPSARAVAGDTIAALSQTILVTGSGVSWSHVLLAWRPSSIFGQGANVTSRDSGPTGVEGSRVEIAAMISLGRSTGVAIACGRSSTPEASPRRQ